MRTLIVGAGGIGGNLAARLAAAHAGEHEIWLLARGDHGQRIREHGLELRQPTGTIVAHPRVIEQLSDASDVDLAILAVKDAALPMLLPDLPAVLAPSAWILPLLNGLPRAETLAQHLPMARLFEACIYVASRRIEPGVIEQQSPFCRVVLQATFASGDNVETSLGNWLRQGEVTCIVSRSIAEEMWSKYLFVCPMAGVTSLYQRTFGEVLDDPVTRDLLVTSMTEIVTLAKACGVSLQPDAVSKALATAASFPPTAQTSMQHDVAAGQPTELEAFSGTALRLARRHGLSVPAHTAIYEGLQSRLRSADSHG